MDLVSFNDLCSTFYSVRAAEDLERFSFLRTAIHGEKKHVQDLTKGLKKAASSVRGMGGDAQAFEQAIGTFR